MLGLITDTATGDLLLERRGLTLAENEGQIAEIVLLASRGELKEVPLIGAEVVRQLGGGVDVMWAGETKKMLRTCGVDALKVSIADGRVNIE